jgi:hypothetical protein
MKDCHCAESHRLKLQLAEKDKEIGRLSDSIKSTDVHTVWEMQTKKEKDLQKKLEATTGALNNARDLVIRLDSRLSEQQKVMEKMADIEKYCIPLLLVIQSSLKEIISCQKKEIEKPVENTLKNTENAEENHGELLLEKDIKKSNLQETLIPLKSKLEQLFRKLSTMEKSRNQINVSDATLNLNYDSYMVTTEIIQSLMQFNGYVLSAMDLCIETSDQSYRKSQDEKDSHAK